MGNRRYFISHSEGREASVVMEETLKQLQGCNPLLLLFCSDEDCFHSYTRELHRSFPEAEQVGVTTYHTLSSAGSARYGLSVMAVTEGIECTGGVIKDIRRYPAKHSGVIRESLKKLSGTENSCCLEVMTAFGSCEEVVLDTFRSVLKENHIPIFGGSAGISETGKTSYVSYNGEVFEEACVFVMVRNLRGAIHLFRENLYHPTQYSFLATDVDAEKRTVYEFDGKPAARVLAKALGVSTKELPELLPAHPLGRISNGEISITDFNAMTKDGALTYFARIYNHTRMALLEVGDPAAVWRDTANHVRKTVENFGFMLVVNCYSRTRLYEEQGILAEYLDKWKTDLGDYIGFSGYGEQTDFEQLNQTMLIAVFEDE